MITVDMYVRWHELHTIALIKTFKYFRPFGEPAFITHGESVKYLFTQPHMARVGWTNRNLKIFYCGGSLVSQFFVVSAAHCKRNAEGNISNLIRLGNDEDYDIKTFISHPDFRFRVKKHDIALIQTKNKIR